MRWAPILLIVLAGCAQQPVVPFDPEPPRAALMVPPAPAPKIAKGESLYQNNAKLRDALASESAKVRGLQGYIMTLLRQRLQRQKGKT